MGVSLMDLSARDSVVGSGPCGRSGRLDEDEEAAETSDRWAQERRPDPDESADDSATTPE